MVPQRKAINSDFTVNVAVTSTEVAAGNSSRRSLLAINYSDTLIWLSLSDTATAGQGIPLAPRIDAANPGGSYEITGANPYTGPVSAIHEGAGNKVVVGVEV